MSVQGPFKVECGELFPYGLGVVGEVTALDDFDKSSKENRVQARDKDTGLPHVAGRGVGLRPAGAGEDVQGQDRGRGAAGTAGAVGARCRSGRWCWRG